MNAEKFSFVVFDYDGVIIDSTQPIRFAARQLEDRFGLRRSSDSEIARIWIGPSGTAAAELFRQSHGLDETMNRELLDFMFHAYTSVAGRTTSLLR